MTGEGYQFLQPEQIHRHRPFPATMLPNVCSTFAICIWASAFASLRSSGVLSSSNSFTNGHFGAMFSFPTFFPVRVSSAPFPLFPRVILPPVFRRAYSAPAHKIKASDRADQTVIKAVQSTSDF